MDRRRIINQHELPKGLAGVDETLVLLALLLIVLVVLQVLEMEDERIIKALVHHRALLNGGRLSDEAMHEVGDFFQADEFALEGGAVGSGEVLLEPEIDAVNHGMGWRLGGRKVCVTTCANASV